MNILLLGVTLLSSYAFGATAALDDKIDVENFKCWTRPNKILVIATIERIQTSKVNDGQAISPSNYTGTELSIVESKQVWSASKKTGISNSSRIRLYCPALNLDQVCGFDALPLSPKKMRRYLLFLSTNAHNEIELDGYFEIQSSEKEFVEQIKKVNWDKCNSTHPQKPHSLDNLMKAQ